MNNEAISTPIIDNSGRLMGMLAIAAAPGALLISPTMFPLLSFFFGLMGLTVAAPKNRYLSIIGMVAAGIFGVVGHHFNTPIF